MFERAIWDKLLEFNFELFETAREKYVFDIKNYLLFIPSEI